MNTRRLLKLAFALAAALAIWNGWNALAGINVGPTDGRRTLLNISDVAKVQVDMEGDSITAPSGNGGSPPGGTGTNTWSNFIQTNQSFNLLSYSNFAAAGDQANLMVGEYSTQAHLDRNLPCIFTLLAGVNDIANGGDSNQVINAISNLWLMARNDGKLVVASTIWPNYSWTDDKTNQIAFINAWIRANPQYYDALADGALLTDADMLDHLHPNPSGAVKLAAQFMLAIQKLPASVANPVSAVKSAYANVQTVSNGLYILGPQGTICVGDNPNNALGIYVFNHSVVGFSTLWTGGWSMQFDINGHSQVLALGNDGNVSANQGFVKAKTFLLLQNSTTGPTAAQLGTDGCGFWCSNGIVYCSISLNGSTISTVKQIAP
jgi:lysophospholipase L1-like esterase